jgi:hypothetical protein
VPGWVATAPEHCSGRYQRWPSAVAPQDHHRPDVHSSFFAHHLSDVAGCNRAILAHRLSLSARKVRRVKQFGILRPIAAPNCQFPAAETLQGAVGVQRLAHGHKQQISSLTSTRASYTSPTSATLHPSARLCIHAAPRHDSQRAPAAASKGRPAARRPHPASQSHDDRAFPPSTHARPEPDPYKRRSSSPLTPHRRHSKASVQRVFQKTWTAWVTAPRSPAS